MRRLLRSRALHDGDAIDDELGDQTQTFGHLPRGAVPLSIALEPGSRIGRYIVRMRLGAGGMGEVYEAFDPELDRTLAVKLVHPGAGADLEEQRLLVAEAQALARLSHPNVVQVFDAGTHGARVFVAMELVEGRTLQTWLGSRIHAEGGPPSWRELVDLFVPVGRGLAAAHAAGIVHGDFKPSNVIVGADGRPRVFDFGLARPIGQAPVTVSEGRPGSSGHTSVRGTPGFMAPEQFRGGALLPATDQFAFCVALFGALYGPGPFVGETLVELRRNVLAGAVRVPASADVPAPLRRALLRGLRVDPAARHESIDALLLALLRARGRRRRLLFAGGMVAAVAATAAIAIGVPRRQACDDGSVRTAAVWNAERRTNVEDTFTQLGKAYAADGARRVASAIDGWVVRWDEAYQDACEGASAGRGRELDRAMSCLGDALFELDATVDLFGRADDSIARKAIAMVDQLPDPSRCSTVAQRTQGSRSANETDEAVVELRELVASGRARTHAARFDDAIDIIEDVIRRAELQQLPWLLADARLALAEAHDLAAHRELSLGLYRAALTAAAEAGNDRAEAYAWIQLVRVASAAADFEEADRARKQAEIWIERLGDVPTLQVDLALNVGIAAMSRGEYVDACEALEHALEIAGREHTPESQLAAIENNLGAAWGMRGDHRRARRYFEAAAARKRDAFGPDHPDVATALNNVGVSLQAVGDYAAAAEQLESVLRMRRASLAADHPEIATTCHNLGVCERELGHTERAIELYQEAIDIRERTIGADHPSTAITRNNLADAYLAQGRLDLALPLAEQALAHLQRRVGDAHPYTSYALHTLGEIHLALGNAGAAVEMLERAEEARVAAQVDPIELATTRLVLAKALQAAHRPEAEVRARLTAAIEGFGDGPRTSEQVAQATSLLAELGSPSGVR